MPKIKYYALDHRIKNDEVADKYGQRLAAISKTEGNLTTDTVLAHAEDPKEVFHGFFTWDNRVAAHRYRKEEARHLIRGIAIKKGGDLVRAFEHVTVTYLDPEDNDGELVTAKVYLPQKQVREDPGLHANNLQAILKALLHYCKRAEKANGSLPVPIREAIADLKAAVGEAIEINALHSRRSGLIYCGR